MPKVRPIRNHEIFVALCLSCKTDIESRTLPVPLYCYSCVSKQQGEIQKLLQNKRPIKIKIDKTKENTEKFFKDHEICPTCNAPRIGIEEGRLYYKCGHVFQILLKKKRRM